MALRCTLLFLALTCVTGIIAAERRAKDSCMVHWMVQAGVAHSKSVSAAKRMLHLGTPPASIVKTPSFIVSYLLKTTAEESNKVRSCFAGTSKACRKYSPCKHGGKCTTSKKQHVCNCPLDYTGRFCEIPHPAPLRDLRLLEKSFKKLEKNFKKLSTNFKMLESSAVTKKELKSLRRTQSTLWKCHYPFVARKHVTWNNKENSLNNGQVRSVTFVKKQDNTVLRLLYSSGIYELEQHHSYWYFKIDGQVCSQPSPITIGLHHVRRNHLNIPSVLLGTCEATARGWIGKGSHTISVHIQSKNGHSGWTTSFLEIREICPDRQ